MGVEIRGTHNLLRKIKEQYGEAQMIKAQDKALKLGSKYFVGVMKDNFQIFKDTGASIDEISVTDPYYIHGKVRMVKIHWEGSMNRYAIIHLNEYGSVKQPNPKGKGAIARTMFMTEKPYQQIIKETLEGEL